MAAATRHLTDTAFERAIHGVAQPVFYRGEQVGERRVFSERLTPFLLKHHDPWRYGELFVPDPAHGDLRRAMIRLLPGFLGRLLGVAPKPDAPRPRRKLTLGKVTRGK